MMPAFNEERTLEIILAHVLDRPEVGEVIVVDDGSTDRTWEILQDVAAHDSRVRPFRQQVNQGKGAALRRAISELRMPFALVQDADLEYDPRDYPALLEPLIEGRADVVYGVRGFAGQTAFSFWFVLGNKCVTFVTNVLFDCYISDMETGYKVVGALARLRLSSDEALFGASIDREYHRLRQSQLARQHPLMPGNGAERGATAREASEEFARPPRG